MVFIVVVVFLVVVAVSSFRVSSSSCRDPLE